MDGAYVALRGYRYQFDKTILEVFEKPAVKVTIEHLQDYGYDDYLVQIKYHDTDYTAPEQKQLIKRPITKLIEQFLADRARKFVLYIYFKGKVPSTENLTKDKLKDLLGKGCTFSDEELSAFASAFTLIYSSDFEQQYNSVIKIIKDSYSKTKEEAELYYSIMSCYILDIVTQNSPANSSLRVVSKSDIDKLISDGKKMIFKSTFIEYVARDRQIKILHKTFFRKDINTDSRDRIFIVRCTAPYDTVELRDIVLAIKSRWSRNGMKSLLDSDRYAPYIFFEGLPESLLLRLKDDLYNGGHTIKDGYDYFGAKFNCKSLAERPTWGNKIFFRIINKLDELEPFLEYQKNTVDIYQFFKTDSIDLPFAGKHIKIQVLNIEDIKNIV